MCQGGKNVLEDFTMTCLLEMGSMIFNEATSSRR